MWRGGVTPTTCDCIECYCEGCWGRLFEAKYRKTTETLYRLVDGKYVPAEKIFFEATYTEPAACPECEKPFHIEKFRDYLTLRHFIG